jgi:hypothetical protein
VGEGVVGWRVASHPPYMYLTEEQQSRILKFFIRDILNRLLSIFLPPYHQMK